VTALCHDCGGDTTPCTGKRGCRHKGRFEFYMVRDAVWLAAGMPPSQVRPYGETDGDFLCIGCLEKRLSRRLTRRDFTKAPINDPSPWDTARLASRKSNGRAAA
jgi:hypothetical protein